MKIPCACIRQTSNPLIVFKEKKAFVVSSNSGMKINTHRQVIEKRFKNKGVDLVFFHSQSKYKLER